MFFDPEKGKSTTGIAELHTNYNSKNKNYGKDQRKIDGKFVFIHPEIFNVIKRWNGRLSIFPKSKDKQLSLYTENGIFYEAIQL